MTTLTAPPNPAKAKAKDLMLAEFESIGLRYHQYMEDQMELLLERQRIEELWRLAGFGEPPIFEPSRPRTLAGVA